MTSDAAPPASDAVIACVNATLVAPSARFEYRREVDVATPERRDRRQPRPGPAGRAARRAARAVWRRISPEVDAAQFGEMLRESFLHGAGVGIVEPAASRYQVDYGGYGMMYRDGQLFGGPSGAALRASNRHRRARPQEDDPLRQLRLLRDATRARYCGEETLRGTLCRAVAVQAGSAGVTVWIDDEHVRQVQSKWRGSATSVTATTTTLELWDFGVPVDTLDWSHLPSFRSASGGDPH